MNRKQRRTLSNKSVGYTAQQIELAKLLFIRGLYKGRFKEGDRVRLNMDELTNSPDWERKVDAWREWCLSHSNDVMTVEYDAAYGDNPSLVCLKEDQSDPKWLFSVGDLMPANGEDSFAKKIEWARDFYNKKGTAN